MSNTPDQPSLREAIEEILEEAKDIIVEAVRMGIYPKPAITNPRKASLVPPSVISPR